MSKVGRLLLRHLMRLHPMKIKEIPVHTSNDFIIDSKVNVTFHELFKMNDKQFSKWKKDLQKIVYQSWVEYGEPPLVAGTTATIIRQFETLTNKSNSVSVFKDDLTLEANCIVPGVVASGINYFFPNRAKSQDLNANEEGESLWKLFVEEPDSENSKKVLNRLERQLKYDGTFDFAPKLMIGDFGDLGCTTAYDWLLKWNEKPIDGYDFFIDASQSTPSQKSLVLTMPPDKLKQLMDDGLISENKLRWHSFSKLNLKEPIVIRLYRTDRKIFPTCFDILRKSVAMGGNFPASVAKFLYEKYTTPNTKSIIYDSSSGYGGRMVGALSLCKDRQIHYVGTDPNPDHYLDEYGITRYEYLRSFLQSSTRNRYKTTIDIFQLGSEVIHQDPQFQKYRGEVDFMFTSPPYFSAEGYSDDPNQSFIKFPEYDLWRDGFLKPTLKTSVEWLKSGAHLAWNISDVAYKPRQSKTMYGQEGATENPELNARSVQRYIPLEYDSIEILKSLGMEYVTTWKMVLAGGIQRNKFRQWTRKPTTRNFVQIKGTPRKVEMIYVWRKP